MVKIKGFHIVSRYQPISYYIPAAYSAPEHGYLKEKIKTFASLYDTEYEFCEGDILTDHEPRATP